MPFLPFLVGVWTPALGCHGSILVHIGPGAAGGAQNAFLNINVRDVRWGDHGFLSQLAVAIDIDVVFVAKVARVVLRGGSVHRCLVGGAWAVDPVSAEVTRRT